MELIDGKQCFTTWKEYVNNQRHFQSWYAHVKYIGHSKINGYKFQFKGSKHSFNITEKHFYNPYSLHLNDCYVFFFDNTNGILVSVIFNTTQQKRCA